MGLTFTVGTAADVFIEPYASHLREFLVNHFGVDMGLSSELEPWYSVELGWSGWSELQERAATAVGPESLPHLLSMEAWKGVFVPVETDPGEVHSIPGDSTPLAVGSLPLLVRELASIGKAFELPAEHRLLEELAEKYANDDDLVEEDMDIQTLLQLTLAARVASERGQPLWVVK
jgi:hypothetical protein